MINLSHILYEPFVLEKTLWLPKPSLHQNVGWIITATLGDRLQQVVYLLSFSRTSPMALLESGKLIKLGQDIGMLLIVFLKSLVPNLMIPINCTEKSVSFIRKKKWKRRATFLLLVEKLDYLNSFCFQFVISQ